MDAHSSFIYLLESIPTWRASTAALASHAATKREEFAAEYTRRVHQIKTKRKRTASMTSIHTSDIPAIDEEVTKPKDTISNQTPDLGQLDPFEAGNRCLYAQARRKKKQGPSIRSSASGAQKFRNKHHVIVMYDGHVQEELDSLVRKLGNGRNNIRKGRLDLAASKGFQLPRLSGRDLRGIDVPRSGNMSRSTPTLASKVRREPVIRLNEDDDEAHFTYADRQLESIQGLFETAAHQFLRDGDCESELKLVMGKFDALLARANVASEALKHLQADMSDSQTSAPGLDVDLGLDSDMSVSPPSLDFLRTPPNGGISTKFDGPVFGSHPLDTLKHQGILSAPLIKSDDLIGNGLDSNNIEVDDMTDDESIAEVVDFAQFRSTFPRKVRV
jgi:hypothetical protein